MKTLTDNIGLLCVAVVAATFTGCEQAQGQISPSAPQAISGNTGLARNISRHHAESKSQGLLYVAADGTSYIFSYPKGKQKGAISEGAADACSDTRGDVFLTVSNTVYEYAHGTSTPSATYIVPALSVGCAVDSLTGNLAVTFFGSQNGENIAVFPKGSSTPTLYSTGGPALYCGYDGKGNLFVDGDSQAGTVLSELPYGSSEFVEVTLDQPILRNPARVQWDGKYLTIEAGIGTNHPKNLLAVYQLSVSGSTATTVNTVHFSGLRFSSYLSWIHGNRIIIPYSGGRNNPSSHIGIWAYPAGGRPLSRIAGPNAVLNAVTFSVAH